MTVEDLVKAEISIEEIYSLKNLLADGTTVKHLEEVLSLACSMLCELCDEMEIDPMTLNAFRKNVIKSELRRDENE